MTGIYSTGRSIVLNGEHYPLNFHISKGGVDVFLPDNYPDTPLARYVKDEHNGKLARCSISRGASDPSDAARNFPLNIRYFPWVRDDDPKIKHLSTFYV